MLLALLLLGVVYDIELLDGSLLRGEVAGLDAKQLSVRTSDGEQQLPLEGVLSLTSTNASSRIAKSPITVGLADGGEFGTTNLEVVKGSAIVSWRNVPLNVPVKQLAWIKLVEKPGGDWPALIASNPAGDTLSVRKKNGIDTVEGVLDSLSADQVRFRIGDDPDVVDLPRNRLEGIVFAATSAKAAEPQALVADGAGNRFAVASLQTVDNDLQLRTASGVEFKLPLDTVSSIDFSVSKRLWLDALPPEKIDVTSPFDTAERVASFAAADRPRMNASLASEPLMLGGKTYKHGIATRAKTAVTFRVPPGFSRLHVVAGIDPACAAARATVVARVEFNGKAIKEETIGPSVAPKTLEIDLNRAGGKLTLVTDHGEQVEPGECLHWCDAWVGK